VSYSVVSVLPVMIVLGGATFAYTPCSCRSRKFFLPVWQNFPVIANVSWTYNVSGLSDDFDWPENKCSLLALIATIQPLPQYDWLSVSFPQSYMECITRHKTVFSKPYMIPTP
jgi:hypothetical protein